VTGRKDDPLSEIDISEANARIPRTVRFDDGTIGALGFTLFFLVLWLVPVGWRAYDVHTRNVLQREGHEANGEVTKSYTGRGSVDVIYRFTVDGALYSGRAKMISNDYRVQAPGEKILVRYLPSNPRVNQPVNWVWFSVWEIPYYLLGLGILAAATALIITGSRKRKLKRMGVVVEGKVTGCVPDRSRFRVYYEFTTKENIWMEGSAQAPEECETGMSIPILYLRNNPERNDRYAM
jgi:hypothetical protein